MVGRKAQDLQDANGEGKSVVIIRNIVARSDLQEVVYLHTLKDELESKQDVMPHKDSHILLRQRRSRNFDFILDTPKSANCLQEES